MKISGNSPDCHPEAESRQDDRLRPHASKTPETQSDLAQAASESSATMVETEADKKGSRLCNDRPADARDQASDASATQSSLTDPDERKLAEKERERLLALEQAARHEAEHINRLYAELLNREEEARREWQATFDAMTDMVIIADMSDRLIRANRAFYDKTGLAPESCIGRSVKQLLHQGNSELHAVAPCPICELRLRGERGAMELPPGVITSYPIFASIDPIADSSGKPIAVVQVMRDLTDLYSAREAAERERISLNATIEQMAEGLMVFDQTAAVVRANRQAQRIFGFTLEQMCADRSGSLPQDRFSDDDGHVIAVGNLPVQAALREKRVADASLWYARPDGRKALLSITASPFFDDDNRLTGVIALVRDVTERKRKREQLQQAEKLRALGQLSSGVAHNLNNMLAAVIGYTQLAIPKVEDTDVKKYLRVVEQSARDASRMVERIQNFSRASSRKDEFALVRLVDLVRDAIDITRPRWRHDAQAAGIKYSVKLSWPVDEDMLVSGEPSELREVFVNIILNSLDAMPGGGQIAIETSASDASVAVSFADMGEGMTEEIKRRIFEPFFTTKGASGLGMGLSESYRIIERHGGRIDVESRLGRGTTFTITLPLAQPAEAERKADAAETQISGARVLVIDDEEFVRNVLSAMLAEQGHGVVKAASAEEGLRLLERNEFDLVFTDLAMPNADGIATAGIIKARRPETKVVLMSGYGSDKACERAAGTGSIDAIISKPFRMAEVREIIKTLLEQKTADDNQ